MKKTNKPSFCFSLMIIFLTTALIMPASTYAEKNPDPWEETNRKTFWIFDKLDKFILKPTAKAYRKVVPNFVKNRFRKFFSNLGEPSNFFNNTLQGKFKDAGTSLARFGINTTIGVFGLWDVAGSKAINITKKPEDFGQTMGAWGVPSGPYLFLIGPTTLRDFFPQMFGIVKGYSIGPDPQLETALGLRGPAYAVGVKIIWKAVDEREKILDFEKALIGDRYTGIRNAYLQSREFQVKDGQVEDSFDDDMDDDWEDEEEDY